MNQNKIFGNWINGKEVHSGSLPFSTYNPILDQPNSGDFIEATADEVSQAVEYASKDFYEFSRLSGDRRGEFLDAIAYEIEALGDDLIQTYCNETGLPEGRARGERGRTLGQLKLFADEARSGSWQMPSIDLAIPDRSPLPKADIRKVMLPLGPVAVFGASNFPLAYSTAGGDTASALAVGCPVIVKSHPMHAGTSFMVASAIVNAVHRTKMPKGIFAHLNSRDHRIGQQLATHPMVKAIGFTGSEKGGRALFDLAAQRKEPIPVFAEMGSVNPVVVFPEKLEHENDQLVQELSDSIMLGTGQFCTSPGLIFGIEGALWKSFCAQMGSSLSQRATQSMIHPNLKYAFNQMKSEQLKHAGLTTLCSISEVNGPNHVGQSLLQLKGVDFINNPHFQHEVFGPFAVMVSCKDWEELDLAISCLKGSLTGTIMATQESLSSHVSLIEKLQHRVGRVIFNQVPTGVEVCASMQHGGPYPASTDSRFTAVGNDALLRWVRPVSFQNFPQTLLPKALQTKNSLGLDQRIKSIKK